MFKFLSQLILFSAILGPSYALGVSLEAFSTFGSIGPYVEIENDMKVKILGGYAPVQRKWLARRWIHGPSTSPIEKPDGTGGLPVLPDGSLWKDDAYYRPPTEERCTSGGACVSTRSTTVWVGSA